MIKECTLNEILNNGVDMSIYASPYPKKNLKIYVQLLNQIYLECNYVDSCGIYQDKQCSSAQIMQKLNNNKQYS